MVGRDLYGVFPLRGKMLNVREANLNQVTKNEEINNVKAILGLKHGEKYTDVDKLRYGHIMIMADQVLSKLLMVRITMEVISRVLS